jgi:F0F1-type ATP synthase delta subunit
MSELKVSSRYAKALLDIAEKENKTQQVKVDFVKIQELIKTSKEINNLIKSPDAVLYLILVNAAYTNKHSHSSYL